MTIALSLIFGTLVGLSLGLTGGGGAIFAVPMLVYGLGVEPREAVSISLAAVGTTAAVGLISRWRLGHVEPRTGLIFAVAGMVGAPFGAWLGHQIPPALLLTLFALLMLVVATRMWLNARASSTDATTGSPKTVYPLDSLACDPTHEDTGPACRRDATGNLRITSRCALLLLLVGVCTGVLSGLFGVSGGFVIVPALVFFSQMPIHRAVGTSLLIIVLVSISAIASHFTSGAQIAWSLTGLFTVGGIAGMLSGIQLSRQLSGPRLQKVFSIMIIAVAVFVLVKTLWTT